MKTLLVGIYLVDSNIGKEFKNKVDSTVAINELLCLKNAGFVFSPQMNNRHPWQQNLAQLTQKWAKWAEMAVLFS